MKMKTHKYSISIILLLLLSLFAFAEVLPYAEWPLLDRICHTIGASYNSVPQEYSVTDEYKQRTKYFWKEDFTNSFTQTVLDQKIEMAEHRLKNGHVFAISIRCSLPEDPIPEIEPDDVQKIIYGYSLEEGMVIQDPNALRDIIRCLKTKTIKPHKCTIFLPVGNESNCKMSSITSVHGCTLAMHIILKDGEMTETHGHIDERDWNSDLMDVFKKIIEAKKYSVVGNTNLELLFNLEDN